jgi:tRNA A-37 threonylcarbamoyl transferase component Bud32
MVRCGLVASSFGDLMNALMVIATEVYVADFGMARAKASEESVATTNQTFGPISVSVHTTHARTQRSACTLTEAHLP